MKELLGKIKENKLVKRATGAFIAAQGFVLNVFAAEPNQDGYTMVSNTIDMATTWVD